MSYLSLLLGSPAPRADINSDLAFMASASVTASGQSVSPASALKISTVWACVSLLADTIAQLPKIVYQTAADGSKSRATNHPIYDLIHTQPNADQTAFEFFEMLTGHLLLRGNAYARILPGARGFADQLIPLHPDKVRAERLTNGKRRYHVDGVGHLNDDEILHVRGLSDDGLTGLDPISFARESFGLALAGERYGSRFFGNSALPSGVIQVDKPLSPAAAQRLKANWESANSGANSQRTAVLEEGAKWQQMSVDPRNAQFLELREFQAEDVCRWFRVPPHMVGLTSKATTWGSGIEQMSMGFVTYTLVPWLVRWQQAISRDLILAPQTYYVEFLTDALLRGDTLARYNAYAIGKEKGWLSTNEIRTRENLNPVPGGDDFGAASPATIPAASSNAHYEKLLRETAGRVVRKEIAAMTKAAKRDDFAQAMADFYADHGEFVSKTLHISDAAAADYAALQVQELTERGPEAMADWDPRKIDYLVEVVHAQ